MPSDSLLIEAMTEYSSAVEAAQAAGSAAQMTAANEAAEARMREVEKVRAVEREAERQRMAERTRHREERAAEIVANVPEVDRVLDAAGALALMRELAEQGFMGPEEDYLRELLDLIRKP